MGDLEDMLLRHEGIRLKLYRDTMGKWTVGVGHNIEDNGISREIAMIILHHDIADILAELHAAYPWFGNLTTTRQDAMVDMAFNLGLPRFSKFKKMLAALSLGDYVAASAEMLDSKWARQVGKRANELARMILTGEYHES